MKKTIVLLFVSYIIQFNKVVDEIFELQSFYTDDQTYNKKKTFYHKKQANTILYILLIYFFIAFNAIK